MGIVPIIISLFLLLAGFIIPRVTRGLIKCWRSFIFFFQHGWHDDHYMHHHNMLSVVLTLCNQLYNQGSIGGWWIWYYWANPVRYATEGLAINEFYGATYVMQRKDCCFYTRNDDFSAYLSNIAQCLGLSAVQVNFSLLQVWITSTIHIRWAIRAINSVLLQMESST